MYESLLQQGAGIGNDVTNVDALPLAYVWNSAIGINCILISVKLVKLNEKTANKFDKNWHGLT